VFCDTLYLLFCVDESGMHGLVCTLNTRQSSTQNKKCQVSQNTVVSPDDGHIVAKTCRD